MPGWKGNVPGGRAAGVIGFGQVGPAVLKPVAPTNPPGTLPENSVCCWTPLVVIAPTCVSMFCCALKIPQLARSTDFPLLRTSQARPRRGWNILVALGIFPVDGKRGSLRFTP